MNVQSREQTRRSRGLTLLELVAATVLLALASTLAVGALRGSPEATRLKQAEVLLHLVDNEARRLAMQHDTIRMSTDSVRVVIRREHADSMLRAWPIPDGVQLSIRSLSDERTELSYSNRGMTSDFRVRLRAGGRERTWLVSGETGWRYDG